MQISQQELQHLITVSTGFIDAYIVECHGKDPMLIATKYCACQRWIALLKSKLWNGTNRNCLFMRSMIQRKTWAWHW